MAQHLARIHGTEEDKVNCPFYYKIGVCRHSDRCSRLHHKPAFSQTLLIKHIYQHPVRQAELLQAATGTGSSNNSSTTTTLPTPEQQQEEFLCFYEDFYTEFGKFGRVEELHVVDNLGDHMIGNVYVKFASEEQASDAMAVMQGRWYDGRPLQLEFSPVTDFYEARCRDYDEDVCSRGGFCNFLHAKPVPRPLLRSLLDDCERDRRQHERRDKESSRSGKSGSSSKKRKKETSSSSRDRKHKHHHHRSKRSRQHSDHEDEDERGGARDRSGDSSEDDDDPSYSEGSAE